MLGNIRNAYSICIHLITKKCLPNCCIVHCALLHTQTAKHHGCNEFVHCCMPRPQSIIVFHIASTANTRMSLSYTGAADGEGQRGGGGGGAAPSQIFADGIFFTCERPALQTKSCKQMQTCSQLQIWYSHDLIYSISFCM